MNLPREAMAVTNSRWRIALEWMALVLLLAGASNWLLVPDNAPFQTDFHDYFYAAGRHMAQGQSPYIYKVEKDNSGFVYPPHLALLLVPFCLLPGPLAATMWEIFNLILLAATLLMAEKLASLNLGWRRRCILYLALLLWRPTYDHVSLGSCTLIAAASVCGSLLALQRGRIWSTGLLLTVAAVKPHLVFLLGSGLVLREWRTNRTTKLFAAGVLGVLCSVLITWAVAPDWPATLWAHRHDAYDYWGSTTGLRTLLATPAGASWLTEGIYWSVYIGMCGWLLWKWADRHADMVWLSGLTLSVTLLITPYAHNYDYVLLILPFMLVLRRITAVTVARKRLWMLAGLVALTWIASSINYCVHSLLEHPLVWSTLSRWFGENWVEEAWEALRWQYRFFVLLVPLVLTLALLRRSPQPPTGNTGALPDPPMRKA